MLARAIAIIEKAALYAGRLAAVLMLLMILTAGFAGLVQLLLKYREHLSETVLDWVILIAQAQWAMDLPQFLFGWIFLLGAAYTLQQRGHVRIDVLYNRCSTSTRALIELAGTWLLLVPMCTVFIILGYDFVWQSVTDREGAAQIGGIPNYGYKLALAPLPLLLLVQAAANTLHAIHALRTGSDSSPSVTAIKPPSV